MFVVLTQIGGQSRTLLLLMSVATQNRYQFLWQSSP